VTARLHAERLEGAAPAAATVLFTHGIFGSGGNWRSIARAVMARCPGWSALLVDLRLHGRSEAGAPPHTIDACAEDLAALLASERAAGRPVSVVVGHSFGGKVVLALRGRGEPLAQTWLLDSSPSAKPGAWESPDNDVRDVWESLAALDRVWSTRDDFIAAMRARGHSQPLAAWLAMNLVPTPASDGGGATGLRLRLELPAVRDLVLDYLARDLWPALTDPALAGDVHVVIATRATVVSADDRARLAALPPTARVHAHTVDAGHWLHLDAAPAVVDLLATNLPAS
jgi:pimeloyl-ACP methyl ester carboxylesterase